MRDVGIVGFGSYVPARRLGVEFFGDASADQSAAPALTRPPRFRHHVAPDERAAEMIERAARTMFDRLALSPEGNVDILLTNVLLPDALFTGSGAEVAHRLGCDPKIILDLHNTGCASFPYLLKLAKLLIDSGEGDTALIANVQNSAGQIFAQDQVRGRGHASTPGDGCGVAYLTAGGPSPILGVFTKNSPEYARDVRPVRQDGRKYWEPGDSEVDVEFDKELGADIIARGNRLVPEVVSGVCATAGIARDDIDILVTNQPNRIFLKNWSADLGLKSHQHIDTFDLFGNLYGAAAPITMDHAIRDGSIDHGDLVVIAGFAHAGDFAAAGLVHWHGASQH
ncbi:3-oxoacyl-ACP synthase III family protein [Nocardia sp. NPDC051321]|uniref:3-oxoacyl-ACP synthase III family protein n=1 Tax=Nocardia sp. NPDC051321 TaxID=3364323 RepID=UPI0037934543